jgi:hypothetical protein
MMMLYQFNPNHRWLIQEFIKVFNGIILLTTSLGVFKEGSLTHSHLAIFCGYYSFVSSLEPLKVEEALDDPDWRRST